ncbi:MAG: hypothetical protein EZS26_001124 [Candidatus Ordinivivax streblomastigis]|uniref:Porin n=1 Tax=Candidatus Ordinivivax streblomastigis TaxID=2540710 RepID=A0A5M8P2B7_9BACT|nr:MAG: hypothetical protein EZS26_001124 [Candidatus Ordinivivax streblomastigis]
MKHLVLIALLTGCVFTHSPAQNKKLVLGGYGEAVAQRMFFSDNVQRYTYPESNKDASHGRFDLPHVVVYASYDFGKGWKMSSEIEFEHGGSGSTYEIEKEETGEYETEIEKGGEVALEQFWLEKTFSDQAHLRLGHIIVPIGLTNQYHLPTEFFSVLRPEEESAILPCTWHQTGISFWGKAKDWRYEAQLLPGLDAERFNNANWIQGGAVSPYEFEIANSYAGALRIDNYSVPALRIGFSGYYGQSALNSLKWDRYNSKNVGGTVTVGTIDAVYNGHNLLARANFIYGHLLNSYTISMINRGLPSASPSPKTNIASDVLSYYVEAGYNVLSLFPDFKGKEDKLYLYGHYGFYDSMYKTDKRITPKGWSSKTILSAGINYFPIKEIVVKAEYSFRKLKEQYNNEPTVSLGIAYAGLFKL